MHFSRGLFDIFHTGWAGILLSFGLLFGQTSPVSASTDTELDAPRWESPHSMLSDDGFADLQWSGASDHVLYRLTEFQDNEERISFLEGRQVRIYRAVPGSYEFRLQACAREKGGLPVCGKQSKRLTLEVSAALLEKALASGGELISGNASMGATDTLPGGPDQLRPGLWYNPDRDGHGYSFFWANRLSLPESNALHGFSYDL